MAQLAEPIGDDLDELLLPLPVDKDGDVPVPDADDVKKDVPPLDIIPDFSPDVRGPDANGRDVNGHNADGPDDIDMNDGLIIEDDLISPNSKLKSDNHLNFIGLKQILGKEYSVALQSLKVISGYDMDQAHLQTPLRCGELIDNIKKYLIRMESKQFWWSCSSQREKVVSNIRYGFYLLIKSGDKRLSKKTIEGLWLSEVFEIFDTSNTRKAFDDWCAEWKTGFEALGRGNRGLYHIMKKEFASNNKGPQIFTLSQELQTIIGRDRAIDYAKYMRSDRKGFLHPVCWAVDKIRDKLSPFLGVSRILPGKNGSPVSNSVADPNKNKPGPRKANYSYDNYRNKRDTVVAKIRSLLDASLDARNVTQLDNIDKKVKGLIRSHQRDFTSKERNEWYNGIQSIREKRRILSEQSKKALDWSFLEEGYFERRYEERNGGDRHYKKSRHGRDKYKGHGYDDKDRDDQKNGGKDHDRDRYRDRGGYKNRYNNNDVC